MKFLKYVFLVTLGMLVLASAGFAQRVPKSDIKSSKHDFMAGTNITSTWTAASWEMCNFCHIAHKFGSAPTGPSYLLWNHTLSSVSSYGTYTSDSMVNNPTDLGGQMTVSNLCLSCHDGTVAIASWYETQIDNTYAPLSSADVMMSDTTVRDLTKQHPINFAYPDSTTATNIGLRAAVDTKSVDGAGLVPLYNNKMQCATCHDPHAGKADLFFRPFPATTEVTATGSFCVYCHT